MVNNQRANYKFYFPTKMISDKNRLLEIEKHIIKN